MMMNIRRCCLGVPVALLILAAAPVWAQNDASDGRKLVLDDYGSFYSPGAPRISPDGRQIAYVLDEQIFKDYLQRIPDWFDHYVLNDQMQISRRQEN